MEATSNFRDALQEAYNRRAASGLITGNDFPASYILRHPVADVSGKLINRIDILHRRVRRLYIRKTWNVSAIWGGLDWSKLVDWLMENWDEILKIIMMILPFIFR